MGLEWIVLKSRGVDFSFSVFFSRALTILLGRPTTVNGRGNSTEDGPRHRACCARLRSKLTLLGLAGCGIVPTGVVEIAECVSIGQQGCFLRARRCARRRIRWRSSVHLDPDMLPAVYWLWTRSA